MHGRSGMSRLSTAGHLLGPDLPAQDGSHQLLSFSVALYLANSCSDHLEVFPPLEGW
jgi:hypothetical protein